MLSIWFATNALLTSTMMLTLLPALTAQDKPLAARSQMELSLFAVAPLDIL